MSRIYVLFTSEPDSEIKTAFHLPRRLTPIQAARLAPALKERGLDMVELVPLTSTDVPNVAKNVVDQLVAAIDAKGLEARPDQRPRPPIASKPTDDTAWSECPHPEGAITSGPRVPVVYGTLPTQVCTCGAWRVVGHGTGPWRTGAMDLNTERDEP